MFIRKMTTDMTKYETHAKEFSTNDNQFISVVDNINWTSNYNNFNTTDEPCTSWRDIQHTIFQLANLSFTIAYISSTTKKGILFMRCWLIFGLLLFCGWAWNVICAPDIFIWNLVFILINIGQVFYIIFQLRPVQFDTELEDIYKNLFEPFKIPRVQFKRTMSLEYAQIMSLHAGEAYAVQNLTRTDRLGLLLSGKVTYFNLCKPVQQISKSLSNLKDNYYLSRNEDVVIIITKIVENIYLSDFLESIWFQVNVMLSGNQYLHSILPCEFLDSPEFESSRNTSDDKFNVSIVAASSCRYIFWQRTALEYLFVKEPYVATVLTTLIAKDITTKLYSMNNKIFTAKGCHLDIRLPSITSSLTSTGEYKSPIRVKDKGQNILSPESLYQQSNYRALINDKDTISEMTPLTETEAPSADDLTSNDVESWLETSSKYHSCELVDLD